MRKGLEVLTGKATGLAIINFELHIIREMHITAMQSSSTIGDLEQAIDIIVMAAHNASSNNLSYQYFHGSFDVRSFETDSHYQH